MAADLPGQRPDRYRRARVRPSARAGQPGQDAARVDTAGTVLLGVTVLALLIPLTEGESLRWPAWTLGLLAAAPLALAAFAAAEARSERPGRTPLVPHVAAAAREHAQGAVLALPFFAGFGAFMFCYALLVQQGLRDSALVAGTGLVPMAAAFLAASLCTSRLLALFGSRDVHRDAARKAAAIGTSPAPAAGHCPQALLDEEGVAEHEGTESGEGGASTAPGACSRAAAATWAFRGVQQARSERASAAAKAARASGAAASRPSVRRASAATPLRSQRQRPGPSGRVDPRRRPGPASMCRRANATARSRSER